MTQLDSRFYDDGREYTARDWGQVFQYLAGDGVMPGEGLEFQITENNPLSMVVHISTGVCFIEGRYGKLEEATSKTVADADGSYDRIDRVVIRMDQVNGMDVYIKQGEALADPVPPELMRTEAIHEISVAQIYVEAGVNVIRQSNITEEKNDPNISGYSLPFNWLTQQRIYTEPRRDEIEYSNGSVYRIKHYFNGLLKSEERIIRNGVYVSAIVRTFYAADGETIVKEVRENISRNNNNDIIGVRVDV